MIRPQRNLFRDAIDLSGVWRIRFDPDDVGEPEGWANGIAESRAVAVPGSWNEQLAEAGYMNYVGAAWLETDFMIPAHATGKRVALRFGSVDYSARAFINGVFVGVSGPVHLPFECELSDAQPGTMARLVVCVDNRLLPDGPTQRVTREDYVSEGRQKDEYFPPVRFDFFPYGGLARPVYLTLTPVSRLECVAVETRIEQDAGVLSVSVSGRLQGVTHMRVTATPPGSASVEAECAVNADASTLDLKISPCPLWSPTSPALIPLRVEALVDREVVDQVDLRVGVREIRVEGTQLLLNGEPIELRGFGKHEDSPSHGRGLNLPQLVRDFEILKWIGANSVRTSHYPYAEEFYDLCDEQGVLVIDETFSVNLDFRKVNDDTLRQHKTAISALIERDRNHPSVIAWSLANEPGYLGEEAYRKSGAYWSELFAYARDLDPSRPLTHANVEYAGLDDPAFADCDFISINRYYGWYKHPAQLSDATEALAHDLDRLAAQYVKPIFISEFGADALAGEHATFPQLFSEEYQADLVEAYWCFIAAHPSVIGGHVWSFADFRTAQHGRRVVLNLKGVFTRDRQPKTAAFRLRRLWKLGEAGETQ